LWLGHHLLGARQIDEQDIVILRAVLGQECQVTRKVWPSICSSLPWAQVERPGKANAD